MEKRFTLREIIKKKYLLKKESDLRYKLSDLAIELGISRQVLQSLLDGACPQDKTIQVIFSQLNLTLHEQALILGEVDERRSYYSKVMLEARDKKLNSKGSEVKASH